MRSLCRARASMCVALAVVAVCLARTPLGAQGKSVNDGVYTETQAGRGQKTFEDVCTACHVVDDFRGNDFVNGWRNQPLSALFETLGSTMPADNPGGLKAQEYADLIAYFLQLNRYPAGTGELAGTLEATGTVSMESLK